jgi:serine/threonine-protein kinase SRPK3
LLTAFNILDRYVALKILLAGASETNNELPILRHLTQASHTRSESEYVITLLDSFEHQGPNGTHLCLVLPLMGPGVAAMVEQFPSNDRYMGWYPKPIAKEISRQVLLGIDYLHQNGIVHTGL